MSSPSLTRRLARLIAGKPLNQADYDAAALLTLDAVANALAGVNSDAGRKLLVARTRGAPFGETFLMGALTHIHETDDLHRASVVHPGCVVVPAAWILAQRLGLRGHALLRAVIWGFEAACRIGTSVGPAHYRVWHNTATCGPFGSAAAAAALLGLSEDRFVWALGNAGTQASGLWAFMAESAMSKHLHAGRAAEAGLLAGDLAAEDFTGPEEILESDKGFYKGLCPDPNPAAVTDHPDALWAVHETSIKPWPCCRHTHPAIDAALELHQVLAGRAVQSVQAGVYQAALDVCDRADPQTEYQAKFSLQHTIAAALSDGAIMFDSFDEAARARLAGMRARVHAARDADVAGRYPAHWGVQLAVTLADGTTLTATRIDAKGDPEMRMSRDEMVAKAAMLMRLGGITQAQPLIDAILALAGDGPLPALSFGETR